MSERNKTHNGRDRDGNYRVKQADVDETLADPQGEEFVRDDVRLGGAVADTGAHAGERGEEVERLVANTREDVEKLAEQNKNR